MYRLSPRRGVCGFFLIYILKNISLDNCRKGISNKWKATISEEAERETFTSIHLSTLVLSLNKEVAMA